ncbi:MAG: hypothetical protein J6M39_01605 [Lachnospiraceae bacterium]|nr:hypothetical protein [Lachnospiraceae bacterium]
MERDGTGQLSLVYTYGNQRLNAENYNNLTGIYTYDGRGSVSAVIGGYGDFRASYWYDGLGNVKSQVHGYGVFGSGKKYYGYNGEQYNPVTGNQNLRNRQVNIRRQRFLTEDTYLGQLTNVLSINRYAYAESNPLKYKDPSGNDASSYIKDLTNQIRNARENHGDEIRTAIGLLKFSADFNLINPFYQYISKPIMQNRWDAAFDFFGAILGGQLVAGVITENQKFLDENIFDKIEPYEDYIQKCSDLFADETYSIIDYWTKLTGGIAGFKTIEDSSRNKIVTTNYWTFQGAGGYTPYYDDIFHRFTESDDDQIDIGNGYKIWIWKGDYLNLGAGGEIGIYNEYIENDYGVVGTTMSEQLGISMTMKITDKKGKTIVNMNHKKSWLDNLTGYDPNENWWLTGWNPSVQGLTDKDLKLTGTIDFSKNDKTREMYNNILSISDEDRKKQGVKSKVKDLGDYKISITW